MSRLTELLRQARKADKQLGDDLKKEFVGPWDGVVSIFCHLAPDLRELVARRLVAAMAPGGKLLLEAYTPAQLQLGTGGPRVESVLMTRERATSDWAGLKLDVKLVERRIFEGMGHQGLSSVIQVLSQKL